MGELNDVISDLVDIPDSHTLMSRKASSFLQTLISQSHHSRSHQVRRKRHNAEQALAASSGYIMDIPRSVLNEKAICS
jgi:hypothetical protein